jgi:thymidylate synthase (FAD)
LVKGDVNVKTEKIEILDHGYLKFIEAWGSDAGIIEAARMSTDKGFLGWERQTKWRCVDCGYVMVNDKDPKLMPVAPTCPNVMAHTFRYLVYEPEGSHAGDAKLLRYLYTHKHMTPFEMAGLTLEVQAPIFVFREWHRHRTQSYSELSARYTELPDLFYVPGLNRLATAGQSTSNKQGSEVQLDPLVARHAQKWIEEAQRAARQTYEELIEAGIAREVARVVIPVSQYSRMRASANLRNWLAFLTLRMDPAAQWEIRQFAHAVADVIAERFPRTWSLFNVTGPVITNTAKQETSS